MTDSREERLRQRLDSALRPKRLDIRDDSHLHAGHAGAADGRGHFMVVIVAEAFDGLPALKRHRLVYEALGDMMHTDVHALSILAYTPDELAPTDHSHNRGPDA